MPMGVSMDLHATTPTPTPNKAMHPIAPRHTGAVCLLETQNCSQLARCSSGFETHADLRVPILATLSLGSDDAAHILLEKIVRSFTCL